MKKMLLLGILCLSRITVLYAQETKSKTGAGQYRVQEGEVAPLQTKEYKLKMANSDDQKVTIMLNAANLKIEGYNGNELIIQTTAKLPVVPEQAKGLRPLYNSTVDNTGIGLAVTTEGGGVSIESATPRNIPYTIRIPQKAGILYEQINWNVGHVTIQNVDGDLELRTNNGSMYLTDVTGPVVANSTNGEVKVAFSALNQRKPTAITTINGSIDVTLPASTKANFKLSNINGGMYTDFDLGLNKKDGLNRMGGGYTTNGTTNGGGVDLQLKTINSDIYIRKQK
ncbi:DUF4097 family beta strand repeat-containing protein [Fibrella forsythiae]|uniref:DUF4097 family beta strand repeat protein n=1 Tax=Fibrella forsythiae TaxID=2817061 RepID=A0ABS3JF75_9BACT|nr:DUF4097 family beta strand repeat-containing protein [Fibrella forsythiae]MBO0947954.1 DUF4097 family beta strand repeat protein [Fibrella forsythiae]